MSWTSSAPLLATAIRTLAASPRPICRALTAGRKSTTATAASRSPEATRPAISTPIAVKWPPSPSSWFSRSVKDSSERTGLTAPSAAAVSMRATPLAKRSGPATLANTWFATSIPAWPFSSAAVSVMADPHLASTGERRDGWRLDGPAKPERSVVLASRGPGAIADIVILSFVGWLSGKASPSTIRTHRRRRRCFPGFHFRRTKRRRRSSSSRHSLERTGHCCRNECTIVEGPCRNQFASRPER